MYKKGEKCTQTQQIRIQGRVSMCGCLLSWMCDAGRDPRVLGLNSSHLHSDCIHVPTQIPKQSFFKKIFNVNVVYTA